MGQLQGAAYPRALVGLPVPPQLVQARILPHCQVSRTRMRMQVRPADSPVAKGAAYSGVVQAHCKAPLPPLDANKPSLFAGRQPTAT